VINIVLKAFNYSHGNKDNVSLIKPKCLTRNNVKYASYTNETINLFKVVGHPRKAKGAPGIAGMVKFLMGMENPHCIED
jgi:hypothetical protein